MKGYADFYSKSVDLLLDFDATIINISGTTILSCYNYPNKIGDHAAKACEAALALMDLYNMARKNDLILKIGINTGISIVGIIGSLRMRSPSIMGYHVAITEDIVFGLESTKSEIIVSENTKKFIQDLYKIEKYNDIKIGSSLVKLYKLSK